MLSKFHRYWFKSIDAASLAVFRIMFGGLLLFESVNYGIFLCLDCMYRNSSMLFKYSGFEWVGLWPGFGLEINFLVMGIAGLCVMLGYHYRIAMVVCTLCMSYLFLLEQAYYLNHYYLTILFCGIMVFVPANAYWSVDARRRPQIASDTVPAWSRLWLVAQLEIVLIYAGLVKVNLDWLNLEPMRLWMNEQSQRSFPIFQWLTQDPGIALASYGVILLHLVGAPLLLWRRTRLPVFLVYCFFHLTNALVFNIGIFPWMTLAVTLMLFDPDWPRQFVRWLQRKRGRPAFAWTQYESAVNSSYTHGKNKSIGMLIIVGISIWLIVQVTVPLRHWFIPGDVAWNEAGHRFSWRMKLRDKRGSSKFFVVVNDAPAVIVHPKSHLIRKQYRKMNCVPDLIWQYAQFLEDEYATHPDDDVKVYVEAFCSLNTREHASLINRLVDLTSIERDEPVENWVLPNTKELPNKFITL